MEKLTLLNLSEVRNKQRELRTSPTHQALPKAYHFTISPLNASKAEDVPIPTEVVFLRPDPTQPELDQLFIDKCPLPKASWRYNESDHELIWEKAYGGGYLNFFYVGHGGYGMIGKDENAISVKASASAVFLCDIAPNCGAYYEVENERISGIHWNSKSDEWKKAAWDNERLLMKYTVTSGTSMSPPEFSFLFEDRKEMSRWMPTTAEYAADLKLGTNPEGRMAWLLTFISKVEKPHQIFPIYGFFQEDAAASVIEGAMTIEQRAPEGILVGMKGIRSLPTAVGYYNIKNKLPFGLFNGGMYVAGERIEGAVIRDNVLEWKNLPDFISESTGLACSGSLPFAPDGTPLACENDLVSAKRMNADEALAFIENTNRTMASSNTLSITTLLAMNPYVQNEKGAWEELIQKRVTTDMSTIMNSYIPSDMWNLLYPHTPQPKLEGYLAEIAAEAVENEKPADWYKSLSTAVLVSGLAGGNEENCQYMNGIRANKWIQEQTGNSKIYYAHSQKLFHHHWCKYSSDIEKFLDDQEDEAKNEEYQIQIDNQVNLLLKDIDLNVVETADAPNMKKKLREQVMDTGTYAKENNLYWAYAFYTYNVAPGMLANLAFSISYSTAPDDKMSLSRLLQKNISVLTILDPSGYICKEYVSTINTFLATNILSSHLDYSGSPCSFDMLKEYLQVFVNQNIESQDEELCKMAIHLKELIASSQADEILKCALEILSNLADSTTEIMEFPFVAEKFVAMLSAKFPKITAVAGSVGSLILSGISALSIWQLIMDTKEWDKMSKLEKSELIYAGVVFGTQILAGVLKRGVRVYAIFDVAGMSRCQRFAAVSSILIKGEAADLDIGLASIGNRAARWFGDTSGSIGKIPVRDMNTGKIILYESEYSVSKVSKIFGRSLEEVIVKGMGALMVIGGAVLSIIRLKKGEKGMDKNIEIISLTSDALMLFAIAGEWAIAGGVIAEGSILATCISIAGPLSVILALVGIGMMLYLLFKKPPSPIQKFVDEYVKPTNWFLTKRYRSIDYVLPYIEPNTQTLVPGFSLNCAGSENVIHVVNNGLKQDTKNYLPDSVWKCSTDSYGITRFATITRSTENDSYYTVLLSLMENGTVCFARPQCEGDGVTTQYWKVAVEGDVELIGKEDGQQYVNGMNITLQAVGKNMQPIDRKYMVCTQTSFIGADKNAGNCVFHLRMSYLAPNYMKMKDMSFAYNKVQKKGQVHGPSFGVSSSQPMTFTLTPAQPDFLDFDISTGQLTTNGKKVSTTPGVYTYTLKCSNKAGSAEVTFAIQIKPEKK